MVRTIALGTRFGRLTVIGEVYARTDEHGKRRGWVLCQCDCGSQKEFMTQSLFSGVVVSCGCWHDVAIGMRVRTHGESRTRLYRTWEGMNARCHNPASTSYRRYGARGITVCDAWRHDYGAFGAWAKVNGYDDTLILDRINNNRGYSPDNCRWVTYEQSNRNLRRNRRITAFGETKCIADWVIDARCSVSWQTIDYRLTKLGWDAERAIITPRMR